MKNKLTPMQINIFSVVLGAVATIIAYKSFVSPVLHEKVLIPVKNEIYVKEFNSGSIFVCDNKSIVIKDSGWSFKEDTEIFENVKEGRVHHINTCKLIGNADEIHEQIKTLEKENKGS